MKLVPAEFQLSFGIPDLRGEFLRGTGTNSHVNGGNGAGVGEHQDATAIRNGIFVKGNSLIYCMDTNDPTYMSNINNATATAAITNTNIGFTCLFGDGLAFALNKTVNGDIKISNIRPKIFIFIPPINYLSKC